MVFDDVPMSLTACLESVDSPEGRERLAEVLRNGPFPHFEPHPGRSNLLVRTDADGTRTVGRFVKGQFVRSGRQLPKS